MEGEGGRGDGGGEMEAGRWRGVVNRVVRGVRVGE